MRAWDYESFFVLSVCFNNIYHSPYYYLRSPIFVFFHSRRAPRKDLDLDISILLLYTFTAFDPRGYHYITVYGRRTVLWRTYYHNLLVESVVRLSLRCTRRVVLSYANIARTINPRRHAVNNSFYRVSSTRGSTPFDSDIGDSMYAVFSPRGDCTGQGFAWSSVYCDCVWT